MEREDIVSRSMKLHPVTRRDTGFHENIWETARAWYPRIAHLFAASNWNRIEIESKSVHATRMEKKKKTKKNETIVYKGEIEKGVEEIRL